jgi:hypothetical protein
MSDLDEIRGKRYLIRTSLGNFYYWVSRTDIMITVPDENAHQNKEIRATLETICRLASKGLKLGLTLEDVAEQISKGASGRCPILAEMADRIGKYLEEVGK